MKKSEIVVAVLRTRPESPKAEKQILNELSSALGRLSLDLNQWDTIVDNPIANAIIRNTSSVRGDLSVEQLINDIDLILKRIS